MTSAFFWQFLTPPPPLSANVSIALDPLPPMSAKVSTSLEKSPINFNKKILCQQMSAFRPTPSPLVSKCQHWARPPPPSHADVIYDSSLRQ